VAKHAKSVDSTRQKLFFWCFNSSKGGMRLRAAQGIRYALWVRLHVRSRGGGCLVYTIERCIPLSACACALKRETCPKECPSVPRRAHLSRGGPICPEADTYPEAGLSVPISIHSHSSALARPSQKGTHGGHAGFDPQSTHLFHSKPLSDTADCTGIS